MHLRVLHRLSTPLSFNNVSCIKGNSILQNAGTFHVQRSKNKVNLQKQYFHCTKCKVYADNVCRNCLFCNVFRVCFGRPHKKPHEFLFGKQSKFLCLTRGCVLTFSRKKRIINTKRRRFVFLKQQ